MHNGFNITLNNKVVYSYTNKSTPARVRRYLDEIESKLSIEIALGDEIVKNPTDFQKLQYVAMRLFTVAEKNEKNQQEIMSAYLFTRMPDLKEIEITKIDDFFNLKLI